MVLLSETSLTTVTLKWRQGRLLSAGSMPAKSTKGCVRECVMTQRPITFSVYMWFWAAGSANDFGWEHSGAGNQWDKATLKKPFLSCCKMMLLSWLSASEWGRVCFWLLSECVYVPLWEFLCVYLLHNQVWAFFWFGQLRFMQSEEITIDFFLLLSSHGGCFST